MWAERGEKLTRAYDLIEAALKIEPDNDAFLDSMGWVLFKLGDFPGATEYLLKAIAKLEKPDATVYDHLGDAYAAAKALDKARDAWAKSVSIEPNETVQKKLDASIKELSR
jgi:tetratricopeptide (TPR) repeat protein